MGLKINVKKVDSKKFSLVEGLDEEMIDVLGMVEDTFTAIIYGESGHGKTNMTVRLLKALKSLGRMLYISWEEGHGKSIQDLIRRHNLTEELPELLFSDGERIDELVSYLKKKGSPRVVVLDSWQYSEYTFECYKRLKEMFVMGKAMNKRKIFIIISHVNGKKPDGKSALEVKRDCNIKIHVDHFVGFVTSRFGSKKNFLIYEDGAKAHFGKNLNKVLNKMTIERKKKETKPVQENKVDRRRKPVEEPMVAAEVVEADTGEVVVESKVIRKKPKLKLRILEEETAEEQEVEGLRKLKEAWGK